MYQHLKISEIGETTAVQDEVVDTELDEWPLLFDDLSRSTDESVI